MSESAATFTQPSTATSGLQPYDLDRRVKNLVPGGPGHPGASRFLVGDTKRRRLSRHRRSAGTDEDRVNMSKAVIPEMISTLHKSVSAIVAASPDDLNELLAKSFAEFEDAVQPELAKAVEDGAIEVANEVLEKVAPEGFGEEPLYKGLGAVGRVANLLSTVAGSIQRIESGKEYPGSEDEADVPNDAVMTLLHHALALIELALRAAVNDHVDIVGDDEEAEDGYNYVHLPNVEDPDDDSGLVVKTALPEELAKFATDPGAISIAAVEAGSGLLLEAGVTEEALGKLFDGGAELRKDVGDGTDIPADEGADQGQDDGSGTDIVAQLEIAGRIAAAQLMQIDHIMQLLGAEDPNMAAPDAGAADVGAAAGDGAAQSVPPGGDDQAQDGAPPGGGGSGADSGEEAGASGDDNSEPPKKKDDAEKAAGSEELRKLRTTVERLEKSASEPPAELLKARADMRALEERVAKLAAEPVAAKGVVQAVAMEKSADSLGGEDDMVKSLAAELDRAGNNPDRRNQVLLKLAFKYPGADLSSLAKGL